jgi:hypothetical protein
MPTARLGAPPVRDSSDASPMLCVSCRNCSGSSVNPHWLMAAAAASGVVPMIPAGALIAHAGRDQRQHRHQRLHQHPAVPDESRVGLALQQLRRGA